MKSIYEDFSQSELEQAVDIFFEADRTRKEKKIEAIKTVLKKEASKRGKKSIEYQIIQELGKEGMSDIAIYAAMALAKGSSKPKWTLDDIRTELNSKSFIDKKLIPYLDKTYLADKELTTEQKKQIGIEIQNNIVKNEAENIFKINQIIGATKGSVSVNFAHQLNAENFIKVKNAIISSLEIMDKLVDMKISDFLNWKPDDKVMTSEFINKLCGRSARSSNYSISSEIKKLLPDLEKLKKDKDITDEQKPKLNTWIFQLRNNKKILDKIADKNVIWPEYDKPITSTKDINNYFNWLETNREHAQKIISKYKTKQDIDLSTNAEYTYEKLIKEIKKEVKKIENSDILEPEEELKIASQLADKFLTKPGVEKVLEDEGNTDTFGELVGIISKEMKGEKRGRPENFEGELDEQA